MLAPSRGRTALVVRARESRIGSKPIAIPKGVTVTLSDGPTLKVKVGVTLSSHVAAD